VAIRLPAGEIYTPGVKQRLLIELADATQRRWGFQLTARLESSLAEGQAGSLAAVDSNAQVICDNGRRGPCTSASVVQFATHTLAGTRNGTSR